MGGQREQHQGPLTRHLTFLSQRRNLANQASLPHLPGAGSMLSPPCPCAPSKEGDEACPKGILQKSQKFSEGLERWLGEPIRPCSGLRR